ncbi:mitochondrial import receptor subunit Tom22-domain-containing protein [Cristinia sonorae]|uniref:Mitochondrial import receptor subunit Tom22-domain-containing protein n=1 Tax=Cristinia sonorae TaxID=1940300 RepID=A0A8K0UV03_9AGAR|nr:mitochondrial import receptor subunit Tom22-domain-containing protein [Cristinia sonorae]
MVKVEIVDEQDAQANSPYASQASSRTGSSVSLSSVGSDLNGEESFYERISALVDIVPPTTRHSISTKISKTASFFKTSGKIVGNLVWIVTTSALLVGLPLAMSLEDEAKVVAQEQEMLAQQQGAQQVRISFHRMALPLPFLLISVVFHFCPFEYPTRRGRGVQ